MIESLSLRTVRSYNICLAHHYQEATDRHSVFSFYALAGGGWFPPLSARIVPGPNSPGGLAGLVLPGSGYAV